MEGKVSSSDPTFDAGLWVKPSFTTAGRLRTDASVSVVSEGTGTTLADAADVTLSNASETQILAADSTRRNWLCPFEQVIS